MIGKLIELGSIKLFFNVYQSVNSLNYLDISRNSDFATDKISLYEQYGVQQSPALGKRQENSIDNVSEVSCLSSTADLNCQSSTPAQILCYANVRHAFTILVNCTEKSYVLCEQCVQMNIHHMIIRDLFHPGLNASELKDQNRLHVVKSILHLLCNLVRQIGPSLRAEYRKIGLIKALIQHTKSQITVIRARCLILISYVISENENDIVNCTDKNLGFLARVLQVCLESDSHFSRKLGIWAIDVISGKFVFFIFIAYIIGIILFILTLFISASTKYYISLKNSSLLPKLKREMEFMHSTMLNF